MRNVSKVSLVGAGPGDPELLTVKALRLLQSADVVVYDRLVSASILELIPAGVSQIYVGKAPGNHHMDQDEINNLLVTLAHTRHSIVRLKGGDPFVFGRGSEEALFLKQHGIEYEVVPGITAAVACSAYAGVPLTHRGVSNGVRLVIGHCRKDEPLELNWKSLADTDTTLVVYMGMANIPIFQKELIRAGMPAHTPVAFIENGTTNQQRKLITVLGDMYSEAKEYHITSPALVVIGDVVALADELDWFKSESEMQTADYYACDATKN